MKKIIVLFHFKTTNRFLEVAGNVAGNIVEVPFDTSLITTDEIVYGYVYAEKVEQSADILKFSLAFVYQKSISTANYQSSRKTQNVL